MLDAVLNVVFQVETNDGFFIAASICGVFAASDLTLTLAKFKTKTFKNRSCCSCVNGFALGTVSSVMIAVFEPAIVIHHTLYVCITTTGMLFAVTQRNNKMCRLAAFVATSSAWGLFAYDVESNNIEWRPPTAFIHAFMTFTNVAVYLLLSMSYVCRQGQCNKRESPETKMLVTKSVAP